MTFYYLLQDVSARNITHVDPYTSASIGMSSFRPARQSYARRHRLVIGRPISAQPLGDLLRLFGAERDGGRRFISRSASGRGSALWVPFLLRRLVGNCGGVRLTGRREGKEGEGKEKCGSVIQNACE